MSDASWMALAIALTVCGGLWTWYAARNRGPGAATRGVALTLLPGAAFFTGTLEMFGEIASSVADWATGFVFSPLVWVGIGMAGLAVVLFGASGRLAGRAAGDDAGDAGTPPKKGRKSRKELPPASGKGKPAIDDDLSDIEAILRKRGIN